MPRYFFDIDDGKHVRDDVGTELDGTRAIEDLVLKTFADMVRNRIASLHRDPMTITVRDDAGMPIYRTSLIMQAEWLARIA